MCPALSSPPFLSSSAKKREKQKKVRPVGKQSGDGQQVSRIVFLRRRWMAQKVSGGGSAAATYCHAYARRVIIHRSPSRN